MSPIRVDAKNISSLRLKMFELGKEIYVAGFSEDKKIARVYIK